MTWRLPAEWEPQDAVLLAWPHAGTDWAANLADVESSYVALVEAIAGHQRVLLVVADAEVEARAAYLLATVDFPRKRVQFARAEYDDTWLRDSGPITVTDGVRFQLLDFLFTGWGGKFGGSRDDRLIEALHSQGLFGDAIRDRREYALEGGAIESDGVGTLLTTRTCLAQRHPDLSRLELAQGLADQIPCARVIMLDHGELEGDDTDAHIDTLVRMVAADHLVFQSCDDPGDPHFAPLAAMAAELRELRTLEGKPYRLTGLPWASPIRAADGRRLAASYANFLLINDAVLLPAYGDAADNAVRATMATALPDRIVRQVPCRALIEQNGSLHCLTMQIPRGVMSDR